MEWVRQIKLQNAVGPGVILLFHRGCLGHKFHRDQERQFSTKELIPKLYNTAWLSNLTGVYERMISVLKEIIAEDLAVGFFPHTRPPQAHWRQHLGTLLDVTVTRLHSPHDKDVKEIEMASLKSEWLEVFNGDPRARGLQHFCWKEGHGPSFHSYADTFHVWCHLYVHIFCGSMF